MNKKILLPLDGSDRDLIAVNFLKENFNPKETEVILLNVGQIVYVEGSIVSDMIVSEEELGIKILERAAENLKGFHCIKKFKFGYADEVIINYSNALKVDMIIMAKNTKKNFVPFVGSVTARVIKKSKCTVIIEDLHTNVTLIKKDEEVLLDNKVNNLSNEEDDDYNLFKIESIYNFAKNCEFEDIKFILESAKMNGKVSEEGLKGGYGLEVGNKIIAKGNFNLFSNDASNKIIAASAAASDARMDGCTMPIMTTAGSGNQGIACSMPVAETAYMLEKSDEDLARALVLSNLVTIRIKKHMGRLSPLCGAGIAGATGASCGITYLLGGDLKNIEYCINNMLSDVSGMICDGAKQTCALKIATGTNAAIQCANLAMNGITATSNDGIVSQDVEKTIESIEKLIKNGLKNVDNTILDIMLNKKNS